MSLTRLHPIPLKDVSIDDAFWSGRLDTNRRITLGREYELCKRTGRLDAFRLNWRPGKSNKPHYFWDSDVAKWVEAASYSLTTHPDRALERKLDRVIRLIAGAQQPDGYLNVYFTIVEPAKRWTNLRDWHELYCAGHLIEAGVAHFCATGKRTLLDVVCRYADHIDATFGRGSGDSSPGTPGKRTGYPGHEEIELALVKLFHVTGERRYLALARYFIDERGGRPHFFDAEARARGEDPAAWEWTHEKNQSHRPVREQREAVGHAVRAMYLCSGMADVAAETADAALLSACRRLWRSVTRRKMYLTGGVGAVRRGEALGPDYFLPSQSAYAETCAACGLVFFAHRMLQIAPAREYADVMERALYNGMLAGVSRDGTRFFYENPLASAGDHHRQPWFDCACCPPNLARVLASLGTYAYSSNDRGIYVHLFVGGNAKFIVADREIALTQTTAYPWHGTIGLTMHLASPHHFRLAVRLPGWCRRHDLRVNGEAFTATQRRGYLQIRRRWSNGDRIVLKLDMPVERVVPHPKVRDTAGKVALQRGPLVYCIEECDHRGDVRFFRLPDRTKLSAHFDPRLLGGVVTVNGTTPVRLRAIPYFLWDNRAPGTMAVWLERGN